MMGRKGHIADESTTLEGQAKSTLSPVRILALYIRKKYLERKEQD